MFLTMSEEMNITDELSKPYKFLDFKDNLSYFATIDCQSSLNDN